MAKLKQKDNLKIKYAHFIYLFLINDMSKKLKDLGHLMYLNKPGVYKNLEKRNETSLCLVTQSLLSDKRRKIAWTTLWM